ncbi:MAG: phage holin family protein [Proteobacteria bacterium]|nr:phage holin family protein [Pseudomonadota bacterium]
MRDDGPGLVQAVSETISRAGELIHLEFRVFRAELAEKAAQIGTGLALVLGGAVLLTAALFLILQAIVMALVQGGMSPAGATILVAAACIAIGLVLVLIGRRNFDPEKLAPDRTVGDVRRDTILVKEKLT